MIHNMYLMFLATRWFLARIFYTMYRTSDAKYSKADLRRRPGSFARYQWQTEPSTAMKFHPLIVHASNDESVTFESRRQ